MDQQPAIASDFASIKYVVASIKTVNSTIFMSNL
jgi:hypothetical protein